tara:strand:- start:156 stop:413 length:258 start_codon:yes stop_codon:yes gene_type:complete
MQKNIVSKVNAAIANQKPKTQQQFNEHVAKMKTTIDELKKENEEFSCTIQEMREENEQLKKKIEQLTTQAKSSKGRKTKTKRKKS